MGNREPWDFCETPEQRCTMNFCDENGCQNRKRVVVVNSLPLHLQRVIEEKRELDEKIIKLKSFIEDENYKSIVVNQEERVRQNKQLVLMILYSEVLGDRVISGSNNSVASL